jgi:hypothetical protein
MTRRERLEAKLQKRLDWAEGRDAKATALRSVDEHLRHDWAFITQPGHIPARAAMNRRDEKAYEHGKMAGYHRGKAMGLEQQLDRAIFSDDPDAIENLEAKAAKLEAEADRMALINKLFRKGDASGLAEIGQDLEKLRRLIAVRDRSWAKAPFETYELSYARKNAKTARDRVKTIQARNERAEAAEASPGGLTIEGETYVRITFAEKPERTILEELKAASFYWSGGSWCGYREKIPASVFALTEERE